MWHRYKEYEISAINEMGFENMLELVFIESKNGMVSAIHIEQRGKKTAFQCSMDSEGNPL